MPKLTIAQILEKGLFMPSAPRKTNPNCTHCSSSNTKKATMGSGIQYYFCNSCGKKFSGKTKNSFDGIQITKILK